MEWNMMEAGGASASGLGCFIEDVYVTADDCEELLDEVIESLTREDPKLRNGRRKLFFDKIIEKDLVPIIMCCTDEDVIGRTLRLLANLTQPLEVFVQLGVPLSQQCQREINSLVANAKARCTDLEFFKSLKNRMEIALVRNGEMVQQSDCELLNHALLLLRNLLHTGPAESQASETSITLQSMLSSFFLSEVDQLVLQMLKHPQKAEWVVPIVQLLSLVFKDYAGVLLEGDEENREDSNGPSDCDESSSDDILEFLVPSHAPRHLSRNFDKQLQIGEALITVQAAASRSRSRSHSSCSPPKSRDSSLDSVSVAAAQDLGESRMQTDAADDNGGGGGGGPGEGRKELGLVGQSSDRDQTECASPPSLPSYLNGQDERMAVCEAHQRRKGSGPNPHLQTKYLSKASVFMSEDKDSGKGDTNTTDFVGSFDSDSGKPDSLGSEKQGDRSSVLTQGSKDKDSGMEDYSSMMWENVQQGLQEKEMMSELTSGSCLMDGDIIVAYLKKFATDLVCSGLTNLIRCLMRALMSSYEGVLDDSFFMWTVGFFLSFARHSHIELEKYRDLLNLDVFGFLVYQGYRNCEALASHSSKQDNCSLIKYRLHLVVCTLNQLFQILLTQTKAQDEPEDNYLVTLQKCLAQMGDLQRLFILLMRWYQSPHQDVTYLRDLIHTNHTYLVLLEGWVSQGYMPPRFSMLSHIKQYATVDMMQKYGSLLEQYAANNEALNVSIMTMMYHIAGDCQRGEVLLQLPILKKFSEIWGDVTCAKFVEFNDLIEYILDTFMSMAFKDPVKCAQKLFDVNSSDLEEGSHTEQSESVPNVGVLSEEDQDLIFTWTTDLEGSVSMVDDLVQRLNNRGSSATRQQVMLHLLHNGWLEEKQMVALSDEIQELKESSWQTKKVHRIQEEITGLDQEQLVAFLVEKLMAAGYEQQLRWLQEQLLEAAYVRLGIRDNKYRVHVEEPLSKFFSLQEKSIPLVTVNEEEEKAVKDPYFMALLQGLGLFLSDNADSCVFCRIPHFLTPAQLCLKAQQLGDIDEGMLKFDMTKVQDDLVYSEFTPLFNEPKNDASGSQKNDLSSEHEQKLPGHRWLNVVLQYNQTSVAQA